MDMQGRKSAKEICQVAGQEIITYLYPTNHLLEAKLPYAWDGVDEKGSLTMIQQAIDELLKKIGRLDRTVRVHCTLPGPGGIVWMVIEITFDYNIAGWAEVPH